MESTSLTTLSSRLLQVLARKASGSDILTPDFFGCFCAPNRAFTRQSCSVVTPPERVMPGKQECVTLTNASAPAAGFCSHGLPCRGEKDHLGARPHRRRVT